jgi:hypothetical protein
MVTNPFYGFNPIPGMMLQPDPEQLYKAAKEPDYMGFGP